ncbi:MAG: DUF2750 domain-containing protein [Capnocytophaga sp.]|nr:DUF2750 domain-containing protein [Capnocytophaga sp.]
MLQNTESLLNNYKKFIKKVVQTNTIYCLKDKKEGVAVCSSTEFRNVEGQDVPLLTFWSEQALAKACQAEEWAKYEITEIPLSEFMELWIFGMCEDEVVAGLDFNANLFGYEEHPLQLLKDLIAEIEATKKIIEFRSFTSLTDLKDYIQEIEEGDEE